MMVVTHEMGFARKVANRVMLMDKGMIVEDTSKDDSFGQPRSERSQLSCRRSCITNAGTPEGSRKCRKSTT